MTLTKEQWREALVEGKVLSYEAYEKATLASEVAKLGIEEILVSNGAIKDEEFGASMAVWYKVPFVDLRRTPVPQEVVHRLPEVFARAHLVLPVSEDEDAFVIATNDPHDLQLQSLLEKYLRKEVRFTYATSSDLKAHMYLFATDPTSAIETIASRADGALDAGDSVAVQLIDTIINYAYQGGASDIHIEPEESYSLVRFRQDGLLHDIAKVPVELHDNLMTRLRVMARLATDERRMPQDGKITHKTQWGEEIEIRLSILPTTHEEKAVMRLLVDKSQEYNLTSLGFSEADFNKISDVIHKPWGAIFVTGPTGSGKTTTLYAMLKVLNRREVNITTIEDPVEYDMEGVNQMQVNEKTGLTFSKGLRSIVRQDPDIIMVGEVRDPETASIAINAAMTGHLVLSTIHTNDAATIFPRLHDMEVEEFLVASTVSVVIAQRLVRKICMNCIESAAFDPISESLIEHDGEIEKILKDISKKTSLKKIRLYKGKGCHVCHQSGYHGRVGIFEVLSMSEAVREAIMAGKNADDIRTIAIEHEMTTMLYDGLRKVTLGVTTLEEILRVTKE